MKVAKLNSPCPLLTTYGGMLTELMRLTYLARSDLARRFSLDGKFERTVYLLWFLLNAREFFGLPDFWLIEPEWNVLNRFSSPYGRFEQAPLTTLCAALWFAYPLPKILDLSQAEDRLKAEMVISCWRHRPRGMPSIQPSAAACSLAIQVQPPIPNDTTHPISVLMHTLWQLRADLQSAFPLDSRQGRQGLVDWFWTYGAQEHDLSLLTGQHSCHLAESSPPSQAPDSGNSILLLPPSSGRQLEFGLNIFGSALGESGIAKHSQVTVAAANSVGLPVCMVDHGVIASDASRLPVPPELVADRARYCVNVAAHNVDCFPSYVGRAGGSLDGCYNIYYGNWEYTEYPGTWQTVLRNFDEIWAPSLFTLETMIKAVELPVTYIPLAVTTAKGQSRGRQYFHLPHGAFLFLFVFDCGSWLERKNPLACIKAFQRAFPPGMEKAGLVIKVKNVQAVHTIDSITAKHWSSLRNLAEADSRIVIIEDNYDNGQLHDLMRVCDAYISLHRAEGFGFTIAESMLLGKPAIVTNFSGNTEFTQADNACLVDYKLIPLPDYYVKLLGMPLKWAEPDVEQAAWYMRRLYDDAAYARQLADAGQKYIERHYNLYTVGTQIKERLLQICRSRPVSVPRLLP